MREMLKSIYLMNVCNHFFSSITFACIGVICAILMSLTVVKIQ